MNLTIPFKSEGEPFVTHKNDESISQKLFRACWLKFVISAILHGRWFGPRGIAYEWHGYIWTCYMRISPPWRNVHKQFLIDHCHDWFIDPYIDPLTGNPHLHRIDGLPDSRTKEILTPTSSNCWCLNG